MVDVSVVIGLGETAIFFVSMISYMHAYNTWNHTKWNHDIKSRFHIWHHIMIY